MRTQTQVQIKMTFDEKKLICEAAKKLGMGHSTFARMAAIEKANCVLQLNSRGQRI